MARDSGGKISIRTENVQAPSPAPAAPEIETMPGKTAETETLRVGFDDGERKVLPEPEPPADARMEPRRQRKRIGWVDLAKAVAIIAIIVGHFTAFSAVTDQPSYIPWAHDILEWCYSFHVPLFFIVSGYCMRDAVMGPRKLGLLAWRTALPYIVTGVLIILVGMRLSPHHDLEPWLAALAYGVGGYGQAGALIDIPGNVAIGVIWFLPALFVAKCLVSYTSKLPNIVRLPLFAGCFAGGLYWASLITMPMSIQEGISYSLYVFLGAMLSRYDIVNSLAKPFATSDKAIWKTVKVISHLVIVGCGIWYMYMLSTGTMREPLYCNNEFYQPWIDAFGTIAASLLVILACVRIEQLNSAMGGFGRWLEEHLEMIGRSTLPIFCFHGVTICWADNIIKWMGDLCSVGYDPVILMVSLIVADIVICFVASWIASKVPPLRCVYFPGSINVLAKKLP